MIKRHEIDPGELAERIALSEERLNQPYYQMGEVFQEPEASWPGDKEGRALLAFVSHYKMTGRKNPCMEAMLAEMPNRTNADLYFGPEANDVIFEQQLSGHSWLLRGLCEHYEQFRDEFSMRALKSITEKLFLPTAGRYRGYPVDRDLKELMSGGVSGHTTGSYEGWDLSTDVGCAFMSIDGLSHVYTLTGDKRIKKLLDEMISVYLSIDKVTLRAQTHCTLTAARGMVRMYNATKDPKYLTGAKDIFTLYVFGHGMDVVFQNLNWWGRPDTWTEPCAIVDSLMLSGELYKITGKDMYRRFAARVYQNGFASAQRPNGGAGTDSVVLLNVEGFPDVPELHMLTYEAPFCCTMRLAEGLWYVKANAKLLYCETDERQDGSLIVVHDSFGRYMCGDYVLGTPRLPEGEDGDGWVAPAPSVMADGHGLSPLVKYFRLSDKTAGALRQQVLFN